MGSEQGFQVNKVDPEAEGQTKRTRKNRSRKQLPKPATEAVGPFPKKFEQRLPIEEKTPAVSISHDEEIEPARENVEDQVDELDETGLDEVELDTIEPDETRPNEKVNGEFPIKELSEFNKEYHNTFGRETDTINLSNTGIEGEIPLWAPEETTPASRPNLVREKSEVPQPVFAHQPDLPPLSPHREYANPPSPTPTSSFEEMASKVFAADTRNEITPRPNSDLPQSNESVISRPSPVFTGPNTRSVTPPFAEYSELPRYEPVPNRYTKPDSHNTSLRPSPIVTSNRSNIPAATVERFDQLRDEQTSQAEQIEELINSNRILSEQLSFPAPNTHGFGPAAEAKPRHDLSLEDDDHLELPEVVDDSEPATGTPAGHRLEHSVWHSIEVDSKTGRAVETPAFTYGQEYNREQAPEHQDESDEEEVAVASGQLAVGGITNIDMPLSQPIPFSVPANSTQPAKKLTPALAGLNHLQLPTTRLPADFKTDFWLWLLLGIVIIADFIAIFS